MSDISERLKKYLDLHSLPAGFDPLTADASTREYFRINWPGGKAVACVYPEPFDAAEQTYLSTTRLFLAGGLPVAEIHDFDAGLGIIVQEDLGDRVLREVMLTAEDDRLARMHDEAITLIARIQSATSLAYDLDSIASHLKFDTEKLSWELAFFKTHYFETFRKMPLSTATAHAIDAEFLELSTELESCATVLCHRDFHAANLMLDHQDRMRIIDHQDARIGSATYDLVSFLLDRITEPPSPEWLAGKRRYFLDVRRRLGLGKIDEAEFAYEFRLQTIQRCLKAVGTFSFQSSNRGKTYFIPFIEPMFKIVLRAIENVDRFPVLREVVEAQINGKIYD